MTPFQETIYNYIKSHPGIRAFEIGAIKNCSNRVVRENVLVLVKENLIEEKRINGRNIQLFVRKK